MRLQSLLQHAACLAFALPLDVEFKQTLLEELSVARRLERVLA